MDIFTQKRAMTWTIIILVVINLVALGTILWHVTRKPQAPPPPQKREPDQTQYFIRNELDLSEKQAQRFEELGREHNQQSMRIQNELHRLKGEIINELFLEERDLIRIENLTKEIGSKEAEKEMILFNHFLALAEVCEPEQREKFNTMILELLEMIRPRDPQRPFGDRPPEDKSPEHGLNDQSQSGDRPPKKKLPGN